MSNYDLKLLDCTLRDGGYINKWEWGYDEARDIIRTLVKAKIDFVEVGFLRNVKEYNPDISVCDQIEQLNKLLPENKGKTVFSAMAMRGDYDISKLSEYMGSGIEMIRITAHDYDIEEGMDYAREVKEKGYKLSINPINIMGYTDEKILWLIEETNRIQPYQFSIVDTFGSMKRRDLDRIVSIVDNNLDRNIRLALHLHENMSLSCYLSQRFVDMHLNRPVAIDGSLMGIGRVPGNLPIELIADYLNDYTDKAYDIDYLMDAIHDYIAPIKGNPKWGYTPAFFLSARFNLHRNYAEHYLMKGDLSNRDINHILSRIKEEKKSAFDKQYADKLYEDYKDNRIDDTVDRNALRGILHGKDVLVLAPGMTISTHKNIVLEYIKKSLIVISVNFLPEDIVPDFAFFSNVKRYDREQHYPCKIIITSNINKRDADYIIDHNSLTGSFSQGLNSLIMMIRLLKDMKVKKVYVAGADGYTKSGQNYYTNSIRSYSTHDSKFNIAVAEAIQKLDMNIEYITPSAYDI